MKSAYAALAMVCAVSLAIGSLYAEDMAGDVPFEEGKEPPPCKPGEGWCLVTIPATYKIVTRQQEVQAATSFAQSVPARYETRTEQIQVAPEKLVSSAKPPTFKTETIRVMVRPEHKIFEVVPAEFEWVEEQVECHETYKTISITPASYKYVTEQVLVSPAMSYWKKEDGKDCFCLCEKPAKFVTFSKEVLDQEEAQFGTTVPAKTQVVRVQKLVKSASVAEKVIPAEYITLEKQVVDLPATVSKQTVAARFESIEKEIEVEKMYLKKVEIPAKYATVSETVVDQPARLVWRKHKCDSTPIVAKYKEIPGTDYESLNKKAK